MISATMAALVLQVAANAPASALQTLQIDGEISASIQAQLDDVLLSFDQSEAPSYSAPDAVSRSLLMVLRAEGYYGASIQTRFREDQTIFRVSPGEVFTISDVRVVGHPRDNHAEHLALAAVELNLGSPLRAQEVIAAEARVIASLQQSGWPEAQALDRHVTVDHAEAQSQITFNINPGVFSRYGDVRSDQTQWRLSYISRLNPSSREAPARLSDLRTFQTRLTALDSVARARVQLDDPNAETQLRDIIVDLTPASRNVIETGFSLSTSDGSGIDGSWTRRNLAGGDESLTIMARLSTLEQSVGARLSAPHWRRLEQTLTVSADIRNEETDAFDQQELVMQLGVARRLNQSWTAGVQFGLDASRLTLEGERDNTQSVSTGFSAVYETRNSATDPTSGARAFLLASPALTFGDLRSAYVISEASFQSYRPLGEGVIAAGRVRLGGLVGATVSAVPADQRFYAGGGGSVRGYEFQSLSPRSNTGALTGGRSVLELSAELRWRMRDRWGAALFVDSGVASLDPTPDFADLRTGVGVGLRYHFDFAPVRFDIATPLDRRSDEASVQVYIGLGQAF